MSFLYNKVVETIKYTKKDIDIIKDKLLDGELIAFPTDTVFGLACVMDIEAIKKVYIAKGRDFNKPLPVMCSGYDMINKIAIVDEKAKIIIDKFMPGALTIVFKKKDELDPYITQGKPTVGIRVPDDEWIVELIKKIGKPIMVTSANISDAGSLLSWEDVYKQMNGKINGIVCENARGDKSSTIIDVSDGLRLLREGPIAYDIIEKEIK